MGFASYVDGCLDCLLFACNYYRKIHLKGDTMTIEDLVMDEITANSDLILFDEVEYD